MLKTKFKKLRLLFRNNPGIVLISENFVTFLSTGQFPYRNRGILLTMADLYQNPLQLPVCSILWCGHGCQPKETKIPVISLAGRLSSCQVPRGDTKLYFIVLRLNLHFCGTCTLLVALCNFRLLVMIRFSTFLTQFSQTKDVFKRFGENVVSYIQLFAKKKNKFGRPLQ